jgi:hypothetical protein
VSAMSHERWSAHHTVRIKNTDPGRWIIITTASLCCPVRQRGFRCGPIIPDPIDGLTAEAGPNGRIFSAFGQVRMAIPFRTPQLDVPCGLATDGWRVGGKELS